MDAFADHLVVSLRKDGLTGLRVLRGGRAPSTTIAFPEPIYRVSPGANPEYTAQAYRLRLRLAGHARLGVRLRHADR